MITTNVSPMSSIPVKFHAVSNTHSECCILTTLLDDSNVKSLNLLCRTLPNVIIYEASKMGYLSQECVPDVCP